MASISSGFRQGLPGIKKGLNNRIAEIKDFLAKQIPDDVEERKQGTRSAEAIRRRSSTALTKANEFSDRWMLALNDITDVQQQGDEEAHYSAAVNTSGTGLSDLVEAITVALSDLEVRIEDWATSDDTSASRSALQTQAREPDFMKVEKIALPSFDGDLFKWQEFWSVFCSAVHDRPNLPKTAKFAHLKQLVVGTAKEAIDGLYISDQNYDIAVSILHQRFDRQTQRLVTMLYGQLRRVPSSGKKCDEKRRTFDACEKVFRQLEQADEDIDANQALILELLGKFPSAMIRDLEWKYGVSPDSKLSDIRSAIETMLTDLETSYGFHEDLDSFRDSVERKSTGKSDSKSRDSGSQSSRKESGAKREWRRYEDESEPGTSTMAAITPDKTSSSAVNAHCYFCDGDHFNSECESYPSAVKRIERLKELGRCARCARFHRKGHGRGKCREAIRCFYCSTANSHYSPLCYKQFPDDASRTGNNPRARDSSTESDGDSDQGESSKKSPPQKSAAAGSADGLAVLASGTQKALFLTAKVTAVNLKTGKKCDLRLALDSLSTCSYIVSRKSLELGLESLGSETTLVKTFNAKKATEVSAERVEFGLMRRDGNGVLEVDALSVDLISDCDVLPAKFPTRERSLLQKWTASLADDIFDANRNIDVLIGADYLWDIMTGGRTEIAPNCSVGLVPSIFGSMLCGRLGQTNSGSGQTCCAVLSTGSYRASAVPRDSDIFVCCDSPIKQEQKDVDQFWLMETIGIAESPIQNDDEVALQDFRANVARQNGRYAVKWPFVEHLRDRLPSNYGTALRRFKMLDRRLRKDEALMKSYKDVIDDQVQRGVIEKVPKAEVATANTVHYLPHHPVVKASSATTKVRIVYDASSKPTKDDVSLNDCLLRGPVILPDLCQLLIRFRVHSVVIISDVEKAFLQILLQQSERDITRFLWYADPTNPNPDLLEFYRFCRVAFGLKSSPFLLAATIKHHLESVGSEFARKLAKDVYVDNVISGVRGQDAAEYYHNVKSLFAHAGMNLQEFCSNSHKFMDSLPDADKVKNTDVKVLGLRWDSLTDDTIRLALSPKWDQLKAVSTKRSVLQTTASVFDPLGLFQPVTFPAKVFLQALWKRGVAWDDQLPSDLRSEWDDIYDGYAPMFDIRLARFVGPVDTKTNLVVFSDASAKGYGACVYLRSWNASVNSWQCNLVYAKSRLAPPKQCQSKKKKAITTDGQISMPRLELLGAFVAARAAEFVRDALDEAKMKTRFFIDSESVLHWLRSQKELSRFVKRRIEELQQVENAEFCYVRTSDNPADMLTRGSTAQDLLNNELWWKGPPWLLTDQSEWPTPRVPDVSAEALREMVKPATTVCHVAVEDSAQLALLRVRASNYSSLNRLLRVTCIVAKFLKRVVWNKAPGAADSADISAKEIFDGLSDDPEIQAADVECILRAWIRRVQTVSFEPVFLAIEKGTPNALRDQLGLKLDQNGLLRTHGRLANAVLPADARAPLLLPQKNWFTELVVRDTHFRLRHSGPTHTLSELRHQYWIPHGRACVRTVLHRCLVCRKCKNGPPFALPDMPPYPAERVTQSIPFQTVGVDYFGPLKVKVHGGVQKMWVSLFTCLCTRAVHLEPVLDCTAEEFLNCFIRFTARRGCPSRVISDNAAQFRLTGILGKVAWRKTPTEETLLSYLSSNGVKWQFIVELAPWQGGHYERLVGVVKSVLKVSLGRKLVNWTDLVTLLAETEAIVNSRPISYVGSDVDSHFGALRPMDFLLHQPVAIDSTDETVSTRGLSDGAKKLLRMWKKREIHLKRLWKEWHDQYLLSLRERFKSTHKMVRGSLVRSPREGEVVLCRNDDLPRGSWKLGRVVALVPSRDGKIRAAELRLPNGCVIRRAVSYLYPLELDPTDCVQDVEPVQTGQTGADDDDVADFEGFSIDDVNKTRAALARYQLLSDSEEESSSEA